MSNPKPSRFDLSPQKRALLERLRQPQAGGAPARIPRRASSGPAPLSFAQQRLWFLDQLDPGSAAYNLSGAVRLVGSLDVPALGRAFEAIVARHESLRTTITALDGHPVQRISAETRIPLPLEDLSRLPEGEREAEARRVAAAESLRPFSLDQGPLLRVTLLKLAEDEHVLLLTLHHIVSDGWSRGVFTRELVLFYRAFRDGSAPAVPELEIQYADFAAWQREWLQGDVLEGQLGYWRGRLEGLQALELPTDRPRPAVQTYRGGTCTLAFPKRFADGLAALCREVGATQFMVLLAGWKALLHRLTGLEDIAVGSPIANRNRSELEGLIGFFVNSLVMRTDLSGRPSFREVVGRVREAALGAYDHQDLPFEKLVEELQPGRDLGQNPLFQVIFAVQNAPTAALELPGLVLQAFSWEEASTRFDLEVHVYEHEGVSGALFRYNADLFDAATVELLGRQWLTLLEAAVERPEAKIGDLALFGGEERREILARGCGRRAEYPRESTVHEQFQGQAAATPNALAVRFGVEELSYGDLNRRANRLAGYLGSLGVGPGSRVGICIERSLDLVVGLLGILKAGGAYVPLDPDYPRERLAFMVEDARPRVLLTEEKQLGFLPTLGLEVVCIDRDAGRIASQPEGNPQDSVSASDLAYVTYTSGSTGIPKGVEVTHRGVLRLVLGADYVTLGPRETLLQLAPVSFDASTLELWGALLLGGVCVVYPERVPTTRELGEVLAREKVSTLWLTASLFNVVVDEAPEILAPVRQLLIGGEALSVRHVRKAQQRLPQTRIINGYGPTEGTTFTCCHPIPAELPEGLRSVPIGRPIANTDVYVLDGALEPVAVGVPGELFIGGDGLARGYLNRPELTAEKFVPNPFASTGGERLYRTGDRVRWRSDGTIEFLGRTDDQVKVRGFRIELGEIQSVLSGHEAVSEVVVLVREGELSSEKRLVAYVVPKSGGERVAQEETEEEREGRVVQWKKVYESVIYDRVEEAAPSDPTLNLSGWNSTYTGLAIPVEEMREQVEQVVERILSGRPGRVLEIGCGTGLLLSRIAPHCEKYVATDFSTTALDYVRGALPTISGLRAEIELLERRADDFSGIEPGGFDAVVLNSVVQYFPDVDYLKRVLAGAVSALAPGGRLFVGDVRHLPLLETFVASVQKYQAPADVSKVRLAERVKEHLAQEQELVVDPRFFVAFAQQTGGIGRVHVTPRRGRAVNELTKYRYDAFLEVGPRPEEKSPVWLDWDEDELDLLELRRLLAETGPLALGVKRVPNARVQADVLGMKWVLEEGSSSAGSGEEGPGREGVNPEALWGLSSELPYEVDLSWAASHVEGRYDVLFRRRFERKTDVSVSGEGSPAHPVIRELPVFPVVELGQREWSEYANDPLRATQVRALVPQMRRYLQERLPEYMVPSVFVLLESMPLTPNGKLDTRALLAKEIARGEVDEVFEGPRTPLEEELARIWAQVLGVARVGIRDNFFELGGDSILSIQIIARANQAGLRLTPKQIFQAQTIAELALVVGTSQLVEAEQGLVRGSVPLTPIQSWFFEQELEEVHHFNQAALLEVRRELSPEVVQEAVRALEAHHDALRLRFERTGLGWRQAVTLSETTTFARVDLSRVGLGEERSAVERVAAEAQKSLSLEGPLWRVVWMDLGSGRGSRLLVVIHHLAVDGVSWRLLLEDLERVCGQLGRGEPVRLPAKTTSFKEWSEKLRTYAESDELKGQLSYWRGVHAEGSKLLPVDGAREEGTTADTGTVTATFEVEETRALLQEVPRAYHSQVTDVLLAAVARSFAQWTGERSLLLDLEGHGREEVFEGVDVSRTVGWFTSLFPVRVALSAGEGIGEDLKVVKEQLRSVPERGLGYGVLRYLGDEEGRSLAASRGAEVSFNYLGRFDQGQDAAALFGMAKEGSGAARSPKAKRRYLLEIGGGVANGRLSLTWTYSKKAHRKETIEGLVARFEQELRGILVHCLSEGAGGHTPSDFPLAGLDQTTLDRVLGADRDVEDVYPLSPMQEGLLFHCLLEPESAVYFEQLSIELRGDLDASSLARAWQQVVDRHSVFRTRFVWEGLSRPVQVVERKAILDWEERDLRGLEEKDKGEAFERLLAQDRERGLDPSQAPLTRVLLVRTGEDSHRLVWDFHHLSLDGWCLPLILKEVSAAYEALRSGRRSELPPVPSYRGYIAWLQEQDLEQAERYWRQALAGLGSSTPLPLDRAPSRSRDGSMETRTQAFQITGPLHAALKALGRQHRLTLNTLVQGAWAILLGRYSGKSDVVFGATVSGRPAGLPGVESMVGLFINTLPLRVQLSPEKPLLAWLEELQAQQVEQRQYEFSPLVKVQGWSEVPPGQPVFESILAFENYPANVSAQGLGTIGEVAYHGRTSYPLTIVAIPRLTLTLRVSYDPQRFDGEAILRLGTYLTEILEAVAKDANRTLAELPGLPAGEEQLLDRCNATEREYPRGSSLGELFEAQAQRTPDAEAMAFGKERLTYAELDVRSNRLARQLRALGIRAETRVGICVERTAEMVVGLLGILKAGGAYVPLDPSYPKERLALMLADSGVGVLLTQESLLGALPEHEAKVLCLDRDRQQWAAESGESLGRQAGGDNLAYVIYTSGSTGLPKGVAVPQRAVSRLVLNTDYVPIEPADRIAQASNASFDAATFEIWGALLNGACLVGISREVALSPRDLGVALRREGVTALFLTTALFDAVAREEPTAFAGLTHLLFGGEAVDPASVRKVLAVGGPQRLLHVYGPTETTTYATWQLVEEVEEQATTVPIGGPIANTSLHVLGPDLERVPLGVPGELFIGGDGLARGYLGHPVLTAERFVPDPFGSEPGGRLYRTGDRVKRRADGQIEFLGRSDDQVKIRGFRVEPGEVESLLGQHPAVREVLVMVREDVPGDKRLVGYVVLESSGVSIADLKHHLEERLPEYMVPSAIVLLDRLPLNPNGKVDRKALPAPQGRPELQERYVEPRNPVEEAVCEVWREVLGVERVGVHDDFFDLGGHSLMVTQVVSRLRHAFRVELPLRALFESPTVAGLAARIEEARRPGGAEAAPPILPVPREGELPLSFAQQRLWFLDQMGAGAAYNIPWVLRLKGTLDVEALRSSLNDLVRRHEALRTVFPSVKGQAAQVIGSIRQVLLEQTDLSGLPEGEREQEARRRVGADAGRPFDLARGPLMRTSLLHLGPLDHVLVVTIHHIVADGWSMGVLTRELTAHYRAAVEGERAGLPELPVQYADFACWQRKWLRGAALERQLSYWRQRLGGEIPRLELPADRPRPAVQTYRGGACTLVFPKGVAEGLAALCRREGATQFMVLLAGWKALLHRLTGLEDIAVGSPIANRNRSELEGLIGFFVNSLVMRTDLSGRPSFREVVGRVREAALGAYDHQDLPFEKLVEELQPGRDLGQNPLFQVMFAVQNAPFSALALPGLQLSPFRRDAVTTRFDLEVHVFGQFPNLVASVVYNADLFDAATVELLGRQWLTLLEGAVERPEAKIGDLPLFGGEERREILARGCGRRADYPRESTVHEQFQGQAAATPNALAVRFGLEELSYGDLNRRANRLAGYLGSLGVGPGSRVGICIERSLDLVVGLLGILKAGGAYVPLDPDYPRERLAFMVEDARPRVLLTEEKQLGFLPTLGLEVVCIDRDAGRIASQPEGNPQDSVSASDLAYVTYTSGSTGIPKGVEVTHRGVLRLVLGADYVTLGPRETLLQLAPVSFDASTLELWGALLLGGVCVVYPERVPTTRELGEVLAREKVSTLWLTASLFNVVVDEAPEILAPVRQLLIGGEALSVRHVRKAQQRLPQTRIINGYGPTEGTTFTCCHPIPAELPEGLRSVPIGRPIANTDVYVLDGALEPVAVGVPGELFIGGDGLARGYLNRPELTAEKFVPNPFASTGGERLYRTGDRVRWRSDGTIEFLGRTDDQVKVRGFRIELGEIQSVLSGHEAVSEVVVLVREGELSSEKRLVAYVVPKSGGERVAQEETEEEREGRVVQWKKVYESVIYDRVEEAAPSDPTLNLSGWNSTYTGLAIPVEEMREQVEQVVERILSGRPGRVLEIGCGTGLLLSRIAPHCEKYVATDFSTTALDYVRGALPTISGLRAEIELLERRADDFSGIEPGGFDAVVLNSVVQYFPDVDYLKRVLAGAVSALAPGGRLFVGDVRHLPLLETFVASVQKYQAPADVSKVRLAERVKEHLAQEQELVVDPRFFVAFAQQTGGIGRVHVTPRRGRAVNELTKYRYDAFLEVGPRPEEKSPVWLDWDEDELDLLELRRLLAETGPLALGVKRVPNARVQADVLGMKWVLEEGSSSAGSGEEGPGREGVNPEALWGLSSELPYEVDLSWAASHVEGRYDVLFRRRFERKTDVSVSGEGSPAHPVIRELPVFPVVELGQREWSEYANDPLRATQVRALVPQMRRYLQERVPEYMVPSVFVLLESMPLTPNGKLDTRALPSPELARARASEVFVAPRTPTEQVVANVLAEVLGLGKVSVHDRFFDLGGHSLLATQVVSRLRDALQAEVPLRLLFEQPTAAGLAAALLADPEQGSQVAEVAAILVEVAGLSDHEAEGLLADGGSETA